MMHPGEEKSRHTHSLLLISNVDETKEKEHHEKCDTLDCDTIYQLISIKTAGISGCFVVYGP